MAINQFLTSFIVTTYYILLYLNLIFIIFFRKYNKNVKMIAYNDMPHVKHKRRYYKYINI